MKTPQKKFSQSLFDVLRSKKEPGTFLDLLLGNVPEPTDALWRRTEWAKDLLHWLFSAKPLKGVGSAVAIGLPTAASERNARVQALRMKWLIHVLGRQPEWKKRVSALLQSLAQETRLMTLLASTGLHRQSGLFAEFVDRLERRVLPYPVDDQDLDCLVLSGFQDVSDALAIAELEPQQFGQLVDLFGATGFEKWSADLRASIQQLSLQIAALGTHPELRARSGANDIENTPFFRLNEAVRARLKQSEVRKAESNLSSSPEIETRRPATGQPTNHQVASPGPGISQNACATLLAVSESRKSLESALHYMNENGVSVAMVYHIDRIRVALDRLELLLNAYEARVGSDRAEYLRSVQSMVARLVLDSVRSRGLKTLFSDNFSLLATKIVENSAQTGEHYIAKDESQLKMLMRGAIGGGVVTAGTTALKILISGLPLSLFFQGLVHSLNYAGSFIFIYARGFSLATKQPSMTAATLADAIAVEGSVWAEEDSSLEPALSGRLEAEVRALFRSQGYAIAGNIIGVIPVALLVALVLKWSTGLNWMDPIKAQKTVESFSLFGPTPIYAAWTGCLLFASSLIAGWFHHWVLYRRLPSAIARSALFVKAYGRERAMKLAARIRSQSAALAANISLGFLLGLSPMILEFFGLPLDVRHVTLATGSLMYAVAALGVDLLTTVDFWFAVFGILAIGALNLSVSFSLALVIALKAKRISTTKALNVLIRAARGGAQ